MIDKASLKHMDRNVLITGAAGGIGRALVHQYFSAGANVGIIDLDFKKCQQLKDDLLNSAWLNDNPNALGKKISFVAADVGNYSECKDACEQIRSELGSIDTLINNAGISPKHDGNPHRINQMSVIEWNKVIDVNLNSCFNLTQILSNDMINNRFGRIVCMSSVAGKAYLDLVGTHYATTKAALIGFVRHVAGELGPHGITVNALAPGRIDTPLLKTVADGLNQKIIKDTPLRRLGTPEEVAKASLWLTSSQANFITGQVVDVSGGWLMT